MSRSKKFDVDGRVIDSADPTIFKIRFFPEGNDDKLTIYDNALGPEYGTDIAHLDKANPNVDFGENGQRCLDGFYAYLSAGGSYYVTWED